MRILIALLCFGASAADLVVDTSEVVGRLYHTSRYVFKTCEKVDLSKCDSVYLALGSPVCLCNSSWSSLVGYRVSGVPEKITMTKIDLTDTTWAWLDSGVLYMNQYTDKAPQWVTTDSYQLNKQYRLVYAVPVSIETRPKVRPPLKKSKRRRVNVLGRRVNHKPRRLEIVK